jgi:hypothetical protein
VEGAVEDGDVGEVRQRCPRLLDRGKRRCVVQRRELDRGLEVTHDFVVDQNGLAEARPTVDDAVRNRRDVIGNGVERFHRGRNIVRPDDRELQARRARIDN